MRLGELRFAPLEHERTRSRLAKGTQECGYCGRTMMGRFIRRLPNRVWRCNSIWACELVKRRYEEARAGRDPWREEERELRERVIAARIARGPEAALAVLNREAA